MFERDATVRHQTFEQVVVGVAKGYRGVFLVKQVQAKACVGPGVQTVPDKAEMFELRRIPERTLFDVEVRGTTVFAWNNQAALSKKLRE